MNFQKLSNLFITKILSQLAGNVTSFKGSKKPELRMIKSSTSEGNLKTETPESG